MRLFQIQRLSAVALLVFMTIHMVVVHYPPFHIDFTRIVERMADPLWKGIDIAFLFFVLLHALAGAYAVLMDFDRARPYQRVILGGALLLGVLALYYGSVTILAFQPPAVAGLS